MKKKPAKKPAKKTAKKTAKKNKYNKSDNLLGSVDEIGDMFMWDEFEYRNYFRLVCVLKPTIINVNRRELVITGEVIPEDMKRACVYVMVVKGRIFKIGQTADSVKGRIQSYNCGQQKYRNAGTASVTNYWVLQSLCNIGENVEMYCLFPEEKEYECFEVKGTVAFPPAKIIERIIIDKVKKEYKGVFYKPIGCTQS